jgi:hypothetical protein
MKALANVQLDSLLMPCTHKGIQHALYMWENFAASDLCVHIRASVEMVGVVNHSAPVATDQIEIAIPSTPYAAPAALSEKPSSVERYVVRMMHRP